MAGTVQVFLMLISGGEPSELTRAITSKCPKSYSDGYFSSTSTAKSFLSKPFKTKQLAEKARSKYPERERKTIGVGVVRIKSQT